MLTELRKSIGYIIYERTTSPLWGSFVFSWLICNWKIVFTVFVVSENKLLVNKIDYINQNFINWKPLILYPFISTIILVTILPLLSNGAYWLTIIYLKWRVDKKNAVEKKQLLSLEQSIRLRIANSQIVENYSKLLREKEEEIQAFKLEIEELEKRLNPVSTEIVTQSFKTDKSFETEEWDKEYTEFKTSNIFSDFEIVLRDIVSNNPMMYYGTPTDSLIYFQSLDLIKTNNRNDKYELTLKGQYFSKLYNKNRYESN